MLRKLSMLALVVMLTVPLFAGTMSDSTALARAQAIWGTHAMVGSMRQLTDTYWTKQIGYMDANGTFRVIGAGLMTWEAAFAALPLGYVPPPTYTVAPKDGIMIYVCNAPCRVGAIGRVP